MRLKVFALCFLMLLFASESGATVYFSDHFTVDYNGTGDWPSPWDSYWNTPGGAATIADGYGHSGKGLRIVWPQSMSTYGPGAPPGVVDGLGSVYVGFWWRHSAGWDWGTDDVHKWLYIGKIGGERNMLSIVYGTVMFFDGSSYSVGATNHPNTNGAAWLADDSWHYYIFHINPGGTPKLEGWLDGAALTWSGSAVFQGTTFDNTDDAGFVFGYQSRPDWGAGNISYFDDIIMASTKAEVETFLGADVTDTTPPTVSSAEINGTTATVHFSEIVVTTGYDAGDFDLDCTTAGQNISLTSPTGTGSSRTFTAATSVGYGDTCYLYYTGSTNDIEDSAGNDLVAFSNTSVTVTTPNPSGETGLPFADTFEAGNFALWDGTSGAIAIYNVGAYAGTYSARSTITTGGTSSSYADFYFGTKDGKVAVTEATLTLWVKFDSIATWPTLACKIANLNIYNSSGEQTYQLLLAVAGTNSGKQGQYYVENSDWADWVFTANYQTEGTPTSVVDGTWTKLVLYGKLNTPGLSDGIIKLWVNDVLKINQTAKNLREGTSDSFGKLVMTSYSGAAALDNGYESFDNVSLVQGSSSTTPPSATGCTMSGASFR